MIRGLFLNALAFAMKVSQYGLSVSTYPCWPFRRLNMGTDVNFQYYRGRRWMGQSLSLSQQQ